LDILRLAAVVPIVGAMLWLCASAAMAVTVDSLPEAEKAIANDVDPWGLPFSDQLRHFQAEFSRFQATSPGEKSYALGWETGLRKVFKTKYWFKGQFGSSAKLTCAKNEHENIQIAVMPDVGASLKNVQLAAPALVGKSGSISTQDISVYTVGYTRTYPAGYPVSYVGYWPDPLIPGKAQNLTGTDLGVFWIDVHVPKGALPGKYHGKLTISADGVGSREFALEVEVLPFALPDRAPMPMAVWTQKAYPWGGEMSQDEHDQMCLEFLAHGIDPVNCWAAYTDPDKPESGDARMRKFLAAGLQKFDIPRDWVNKPKLLEHLKAKGWLGKAIVYGGQDEPLTADFEKSVVPDTKRIRALPNAPKVYLASEYHPGMDKGTDIWMTDLSTGKGIEFARKNIGKAQLWVYYCHLPINTWMFQPLVDAPNMEIDNCAMEHRLAYWIAWKYGVEGMFIWAGNNEWHGSNKPNWAETEWLLKPDTEKMGFPYAGLHNGNGFLIYPGAYPSIRMKVIRDGLEDWAYLQLLKKSLPKLSARDQAEAKQLLGVPTSVLMNTHYFSRNPDDLLAARLRVAALIVKAKGTAP
jgi:hypothetical protein